MGKRSTFGVQVLYCISYSVAALHLEMVKELKL